MPVVVGEYLDRLATTEMRPGRSNLPRGHTHQLYAAARGTGDPLVYRMATALVDRVGPGDQVFILTGAGAAPFLPRAEVDGILGAIAVGRVLSLARGATVTILAEERAREPIVAGAAGAGLRVGNIADTDGMSQLYYEATPIDRASCERHASELFAQYHPTAVLAIEKLSSNRRGVIHGATGLNYDDVHSKADVYMRLASDTGAVTCGIGDCGTEVGFGQIEDEVRRIVPAARDCSAHCPCGGGSAAAVATDHLLPAAISNWGSYALAAMLAFLEGSARTLLDADEVFRMLRAVVDAGAYDGATARPTLSDDGVPLAAQTAVVTMMQQLVLQALSELDSPGH
jgi:hypothetical protein